MQEDELARVRSYLVGQAERKTFTEMRPVVEEARGALLKELDGVSEEQARFKPPTGEGEDAWGILEVLRHVIHSEEGVALRVRGLGLGGQARGERLGRLVGRAKAHLPALIAALHESRTALDHAVGSVEGKEKLEATATHPFFGELNCRAWYLFQRVHDGDHFRQIQKIKTLPGYPRA